MQPTKPEEPIDHLEPIETDDSAHQGDLPGFGSRLIEVRELRGMDQKSLALWTGIPASTISYFENGHRYPNMKKLIKLANVLRVSIDYLVGRTDSMFAHVTAPPEIPIGSAFTRDHALRLVKMLQDGLRATNNVAWEEESENDPHPDWEDWANDE